MKRTLSLAFAFVFALAGALLAGCDRPADRNAAGGGTTADRPASGSTSGSAGSSAEQKRRTPAGPAGSTGSTGK